MSGNERLACECARQQGRPAWAFGGPALLGTVASIVVYVLMALLRPNRGAPRG